MLPRVYPVIFSQAAENAGKMANWEDLNIAMPLDRTATLRVLISSRDKVIGQVTITRAKLLGGRKNQKGFYVVGIDLVCLCLSPFFFV